MTEHIFQCGNTPDLSFAEAQALFPESGVAFVSDEHIALTLDDQQLELAYAQLGGIVKNLKKITALPLGSDEDELYESLTDILTSQDIKGRIKFALSEYGRDHLPKLAVEKLKTQITDAGSSASYLDTSRRGINSAQFKHNNRLIELSLIQTPQEIIIAKTIWMQDPDEWAHRDRQRPYADTKKGMLPLKVARMMVNIATNGQKHLVIDPFCGTGTVLGEALTLGHDVFGSDNDPLAVEGTRENISWLRTQEATLPKSFVKQSEATNIEIPNSTLPRVIVTEPFLGKPKPKSDQIPNIKKGLEKLYIGALRNWAKQLKTGERVCMIVPQLLTEHGWVSLDAFIDKIESLDYNIESEPIVYQRAQAIVRRQIYLLKKN